MAETLDITSADDTSVSVSYFEPTDGAVDALSAVLGSDPAVGVWEGGIESYPGVTYTWPGVQIIDDEFPMLEPINPEFRVVLTSAECSQVTLAAVDGIQVGDSAADLEAAYPEAAARVSVDGGSERLDVYLGTVALAASAGDADSNEQRTFSVWVSAEDPSGYVDRISAPAANFGV